MSMNKKGNLLFVLLAYNSGKISKNRMHLKFDTLMDFFKNWPI